MKKLRLLFLLVSFLSLHVFAHHDNNKGEKGGKRIISGKITSASGEEVAGARIRIKETSEVFYSDLNGNFSIEVPAVTNDDIEIDQLGFKKATLKSSNCKDFSEILLTEL